MILWGIATITGNLLLSPIENPTIQLITNPLTLEFIAGGLIARLHFSEKSFSGWPFLIVAFVWWLSGYGICAKLGVAPESTNWLRVLIFGIPAAFLVYALVTMEKNSQWQLPACLVFLFSVSISYPRICCYMAYLGEVWRNRILGEWHRYRYDVSFLAGYWHG